MLTAKAVAEWIKSDDLDPTTLVNMLVDERLLIDHDGTLTVNEAVLVDLLADATPEQEKPIREFLSGATGEGGSNLN